MQIMLGIQISPGLFIFAAGFPVCGVHLVDRAAYPDAPRCRNASAKYLEALNRRNHEADINRAVVHRREFGPGVILVHFRADRIRPAKPSDDNCGVNPLSEAGDNEVGAIERYASSMRRSCIATSRGLWRDRRGVATCGGLSR